MTTLPNFNNYGEYSSDNYGVNTLRFEVGTLTLWYSYKTVVAFRLGFVDTVVTQNDWGPTTGKHLNWIDGGDHENRLPRAEFEAALQEAMSKALLAPE